MGKDYYQILGVKREAGQKEIKQAYRRLARKHHPDVNPGDRSSESKFKEINEAYEVLSDPEKRKKYDLFGDKWQYADQFSDFGGGRTPFDFGDMSSGMGGIGDIFESLFGGFRAGGKTSRRPRRGQDMEHPVEITLEEAYNGTKRTIQTQGEGVCQVCGGVGALGNAPCFSCGGSGRSTSVRNLEVTIPPGVRDGSRVRISGEGGEGYGGGAKGDLFLVISIKPDSRFERNGDEIYVDVDGPLTDAMLGGEVEVPTLKGKLALKIPPETQNGRVFRLAGKGMPHLGGSSKGDLFARVRIVLPTNLNEREKRLFEELRSLRSQ